MVLINCYCVTSECNDFWVFLNFPMYFCVMFNFCSWYVFNVTDMILKKSEELYI